VRTCKVRAGNEGEMRGVGMGGGTYLQGYSRLDNSEFQIRFSHLVVQSSVAGTPMSTTSISYYTTYRS
jgi:hypothetical protein